MKIAEIKSLVEWAKDKGIKRIQAGQFAVDFFHPTPEPMALDPKSLAKTLTDSMPPDSEMLFASSVDLSEEENPNSQQRDSANMP